MAVERAERGIERRPAGRRRRRRGGGVPGGARARVGGGGLAGPGLFGRVPGLFLQGVEVPVHEPVHETRRRSNRPYEHKKKLEIERYSPLRDELCVVKCADDGFVKLAFEPLEAAVQLRL